MDLDFICKYLLYSHVLLLYHMLLTADTHFDYKMAISE